ncbi:MAG: response regulator [Lachnospiraceae bacterium]|nr:response regulator [Lachnospiraceae bacterium]
MRLLLAEDEKEMSRAVTAVLVANGYEVDAVYDGEQALEKARQNAYDAMIFDIMMPNMDGMTALREIRSAGDVTPVIFLTAKSELDDRVEGLDAGADDYLTKPFAMKELLARIRSITRRQGEVTDNTLEFSNLKLDRATFIMSTETDSIRLANKEFQMLEMLLQNPGQIISTEQFMDKIWGYDTETELNVVWVYISYLRKKLSKVNAKVVIKAARGVGYLVEGDNEWLQSIRNQISRLSSLTEKLVFLSRMDEENTKLEMQEFSLSKTVTEVAESFLPVARAREKELDIFVEEGISFVGNEGTVSQCVSLLVDNAMKYSNDGGKIRVSLKRSAKNKKEILVFNTVDEIEVGNHDVLFERFYRSDASRSTKTGGHGIGLSVVKAIVTAHRGKVTAESKDSTSIEFRIILP